MAVLIATADSQAAADLICARLYRAGIEAIARRDVLGSGIADHPLDIFIEDHDLEHAREVLEGEDHPQTQVQT